MARHHEQPEDPVDSSPDGTGAVDHEQKHRFLERISRRRKKAREGFERLKDHLAEEKGETREMVDIYHRMVEGKATKQEIKKANEQFSDVLRIVGMGTFFTLIPGSTLLLPLAIVGANKVGIRLLPTAFTSGKDDDAEQDDDEHADS